jgi:hypothetical protein
MPKIQDIGVGNYIRNPQGNKSADSLGMNIEALQIYADDGGSFMCFPVTGKRGTEPILDKERYYQIPIDTNVEQVTI